MKACDRVLIKLLGKWRQRMKWSDYQSSPLVWLGVRVPPTSFGGVETRMNRREIVSNNVDSGSSPPKKFKIIENEIILTIKSFVWNVINVSNKVELDIEVKDKFLTYRCKNSFSNISE